MYGGTTMRIDEIASAADTIALWKMISDNTWAAIAQQAEAEAKRKAERAAARKSASKRGSGKGTAKPAPPKRLPPPLQHVSAPVPKDAKSAASAEPKIQNAQQQQPVQPTTALSAANTVLPIEPTPPVSAMSRALPVKTALKKSVHQPPFQRNLSNAAGQKK
jgi:hypothetical protein